MQGHHPSWSNQHLSRLLVCKARFWHPSTAHFRAKESKPFLIRVLWCTSIYKSLYKDWNMTELDYRGEITGHSSQSLSWVFMRTQLYYDGWTSLQSDIRETEEGSRTCKVWILPPCCMCYWAAYGTYNAGEKIKISNTGPDGRQL